jgi:hypothetical protein
VLNEAVLRRQVGGADVMRDQLRHLAEMAKRPNITVQVLPFSAGAHPAMVGSFIMLNFPAGSGDPTIFVEVDAGALYPDRPADFERYTWMFGQLRDLGLSPAESTDFVSKVKGEC